jgi:serine/threonine protein kinase
MNYLRIARVLLACTFPCFCEGLLALDTSSLGKMRLKERSLRGGSDLHIGKFVIEHHKSNHSISNQSKICTLDDVYKFDVALGEGAFATVRKAVHRITKKTFAIKTIDLCIVGSEQLHLLRDEVEIMKMLDHPNVIKLYETFEEENKLHLVLELCEGGDLFDFIMKTSVESGQKTWTDGSVRIY